ncbi:antichymotrypsin-2-like protein [Leptotrombidium deliense]|uniref:Antichymotrypsin-2-like protein n=1 Tax=Leptotrombidium deliense TaxID=299467 RepID=A0A443RYB0_9ACAR|nr:antichymotrypsin-2-like protein [Leptotrombidium deliense]
MVIYLPHERNGLANIIENLKLEDNIEAAKESAKTLIKLYLPKFEYDYEMVLNNLLPKVGSNLKTALAGIKSRLRVDRALHKAKITNNK